MKIVFVNRFFYPDHSATSQLLSDLAFALAERGHRVHVVTSRQRYDGPGSPLAAREAVRGVEVHRVWSARFGRERLPGRTLDYLGFYLSAGWCLVRLVQRNDVIVAMTDPPLISVVAMIVARLRAARLVNWLQDLFPEVATALGIKGMEPGAGALLKRLRNASLQTAAVNVVLGKRMAAYLSSQCIAAGRVTVIHNWADGEALRPASPERNELRREWGLDGKFVVGYSGNMGRVHEFATILTAAAHLKNEAGVVFLFIGGGFFKPWIEREAQRRELPNVLFKPYQSRAMLAQSLGTADVHLVSLLPALEGLVVPSKFYGIAAVGRPVVYIGDRGGELAGLIESARCGLMVGPGDGERLTEYIVRLYRSPKLCAQLGSNARDLLLKRFDKKLAVDSWQALLERI